MTTLRAALILWGLAIVWAGCTRSPIAPTAPPPPPTPIALAVSAPEFVLTEARATVTATADGRPIAPAWSCDTPDVIAVTADGELTARARGYATITARYQDATATATIESIENFTGQWSGRYAVLSCDDRGAAEGACRTSGAPETTYPVLLTLTQTRRTLVGTLVVASVAGGTVGGTVHADGTMTLSGSFNYQFDGNTLRYELRDWTAHREAGQLVGQFHDQITADGTDAHIARSNRLQAVTR